jgi:hypothetical protein
LDGMTGAGQCGLVSLEGAYCRLTLS